MIGLHGCPKHMQQHAHMVCELRLACRDLAAPGVSRYVADRVHTCTAALVTEGYWLDLLKDKGVLDIGPGRELKQGQYSTIRCGIPACQVDFTA